MIDPGCARAQSASRSPDRLWPRNLGVRPADTSCHRLRPGAACSGSRPALHSARPIGAPSHRPAPSAASGIDHLADRVAQRLRLGQPLELLERVVLDLADALAGDAEGPADLLERARLLAAQPEA